MIECFVKCCRRFRTFSCSLALVFASLLACAPAKNYLDPDWPKFTGRYAKSRPVFNDTLKVVTFNIAFSKKIDRALEELSTSAALKDAPILLLQEMDEAGTDTIAKALAYDYVYYPASFHSIHHKNFGNAILSKWPIKNERKILLPYEVPGRKTRRIAVAATIAIDKFEIQIYSVHTATFVQGEEKRLEQAKVILESILQNQTPVIVGGDFNTVLTESLRAHLFIFQKDQFTWATRDAGPTEILGPVGLKLDHIFIKGMRVIDAGTLIDSRASDHRPVWVKLVM